MLLWSAGTTFSHATSVRAVCTLECSRRCLSCRFSTTAHSLRRALSRGSKSERPARARRSARTLPQLRHSTLALHPAQRRHRVVLVVQDGDRADEGGGTMTGCGNCGCAPCMCGAPGFVTYRGYTRSQAKHSVGKG